MYFEFDQRFYFVFSFLCTATEKQLYQMNKRIENQLPLLQVKKELMCTNWISHFHLLWNATKYKREKKINCIHRSMVRGILSHTIKMNSRKTIERQRHKRRLKKCFSLGSFSGRTKMKINISHEWRLNGNSPSGFLFVLLFFAWFFMPKSYCSALLFSLSIFIDTFSLSFSSSIAFFVFTIRPHNNRCKPVNLEKAYCLFAVIIWRFHQIIFILIFRTHEMNKKLQISFFFYTILFFFLFFL